eukprot:GILI01003528.1.p1 GENE.GILI01003528.1~~GILI01003528.1.p1  ORF type:complete len:608 (+),score=239.94 GILI01003528.1:104-1927(+)
MVLSKRLFACLYASLLCSLVIAGDVEAKWRSENADIHFQKSPEDQDNEVTATNYEDDTFKVKIEKPQHASQKPVQTRWVGHVNAPDPEVHLPAFILSGPKNIGEWESKIIAAQSEEDLDGLLSFIRHVKSSDTDLDELSADLNKLAKYRLVLNRNVKLEEAVKQQIERYIADLEAAILKHTATLKKNYQEIKEIDERIADFKKKLSKVRKTEEEKDEDVDENGEVKAKIAKHLEKKTKKHHSAKKVIRKVTADEFGKSHTMTKRLNLNVDTAAKLQELADLEDREEQLESEAVNQFAEDEAYLRRREESLDARAKLDVNAYPGEDLMTESSWEPELDPVVKMSKIHRKKERLVKPKLHEDPFAEDDLNEQGPVVTALKGKRRNFNKQQHKKRNSHHVPVAWNALDKVTERAFERKHEKKERLVEADLDVPAVARMHKDKFQSAKEERRIAALDEDELGLAQSFKVKARRDVHKHGKDCKHKNDVRFKPPTPEEEEEERWEEEEEAELRPTSEYQGVDVSGFRSPLGQGFRKPEVLPKFGFGDDSALHPERKAINKRLVLPSRFLPEGESLENHFKFDAYEDSENSAGTKRHGKLHRPHMLANPYRAL